MAFAGMFLIALVIALIIMGIMLTVSLICLIIGIIQKRRKKKSSKAFFIASAVLFSLVMIPILIFVLPVKVDIDTPQGKDFVWSNKRDDFYTAIYQGETDKVDKLLDKNPNLVYAIKYGDNIDGLHAAMIKNDIDTAKCIIEHGGAFDSGYNFSENEYSYSLECYFNSYYRRANSEDVKYTEYECVKFMIENNAKLDYVGIRFTPLFDAVHVICYDGMITDEEADIIKLLIDSGADTDYVTPDSGQTALDYFFEEANIQDVPEDEMNKIEPILKGSINDKFPVSPEYKKWLVENKLWGSYNHDPEIRQKLDEAYAQFESANNIYIER